MELESRTLSREAFALERAVADRFGDMADFDCRRAFEVGDRACDTCDPIERTRREVAACGGVP